MPNIIDELVARGYKVTPQRRIILQVLAENDRHLTVEEIDEQVQKIQSGISVATIYRNLNLLAEIELVSRLDLHDGPVRYELNRGHNHHLVCLNCGATIKIGVCPMQGKVQQVIQESGFKVDTHHFEITGYCRACQKTRGDK